MPRVGEKEGRNEGDEDQGGKLMRERRRKKEDGDYEVLMREGE